MTRSLTAEYEQAYSAFAKYLDVRGELCDAMAAVGLPTRNVDPLACFAEVITARELSGTIVNKAANPDVDVLLCDGGRIQVKSLRVTTGKLRDNGRSWAECTRKGGKQQNALIDADTTSLVVFLDHRPYAMLVFPIEDGEQFPTLHVAVLYFVHVKSLLDQKISVGNWPVKVIDLRRCLVAPLAHSPDLA